MNRNKYLLGALIVIAAILVGFFAVLPAWRHRVQQPVPGATTTATTMQFSSSTVVVTTSNGNSYTITQVPVSGSSASAAYPSYSTPITCAKDMSADECAKLHDRNTQIITRLNASKTDFAAWTDLGMLRKEAGDYQGALAAWTYLTKLYPKDAAPYFNMGDLYLNFQKDYPKAEASYKQVIALKPSVVDAYQNLFTLYTTTSYKPTATAGEEILKQGIVANPDATHLCVMLARYYKSLGRTADARVQYDAAIKLAQTQGNASAAAQLQAEAGK